ncbi:cupin-like domain-containing protein [Aureococcus anophagefferens]|nr:cupin-like domain-containing protein [Aureococcus anophagefferens]
MTRPPAQAFDEAAACAGGHLGYFKCAPSRIGCSVKLADLAASWQPNGTRAGLYVSEFSEGPLTDAAWDALRSLAYFSADLASRNFLVGGDRSGLPFHKHAKTWQMLFAGASSGEILYPDDWWHATLNDADYSVAYGEKPHRMPVVDGPSPALAAMLGRAANAGRGDRDPPLGDWYNVLPRSRHRGGKTALMNESIAELVRAADRPRASPLLAATAATACCIFAKCGRNADRAAAGVGEHRAAPRPRHLEPPVRASIAKAAVYQRQTYPPSLACKIALYFSTTECRAFELFQYDTRPATLLHNATRAWCAQSRCCDAYTFESSRQRDASGFVLPALWARIKALRDRMLATTAPAVVWVDSDVVFVDAGWCPSFDGGASMVVARDPYPWTSSLNHGFFALRNDAAGRGIAAAHWDAWANVSAAYVAEDGECFGNRTAARWKQCRVGGKYAGQGAFKTYVLPRFRAAIAIVPDKTFQSADAQECDGVVKHFAAGRTAEALRLRTVERCAESYFRAPAGGAAAAPERRARRAAAAAARRARGSTASWSPPSPRRSRRSRRGSSGCAEATDAARGRGAAAHVPRRRERAIGASGAHVDAFFYLADDDPGSSHGRPSIREARQRVLDVVASFRPKDAYVGPFVWWATWEKVRRCFALVEDFERSTLRRRYDFVARLRPTSGSSAPPPLAAIFPPSAPRGVAFAAGVVGSFRRPEAANDHVAWASRDAAPEYFRLVDALAAGDDFREMLDYGGTWLLWRMRNRSRTRAGPRGRRGVLPLARRRGAPHGEPALALADLRAAYDACAARWDEERAARPASTCAAIDDAPTYNTWSFPARGDAAA